VAYTFRVEGMAPAPQGSKRLVARGVMIESCRNVKPWRALVTSAAIATGLPIIRGPVSMSVVFLFLRPKGHYTPKGVLRASAPEHHAVKPDGSKLLRSTEDALTGSLLEDDARIVSCTWQKRYCVGLEKPGALITLIPLQKQSP
jgi:Holliday junction resolvase RusA-like endonuclease